jgi:hypothetical protein
MLTKSLFVSSRRYVWEHPKPAGRIFYNDKIFMVFLSRDSRFHSCSVFLQTKIFYTNRPDFLLAFPNKTATVHLLIPMYLMIVVQPQTRLSQPGLLDLWPQNGSLAMQTSTNGYKPKSLR